MSQYKHLTLYEREKIHFFCAKGYSQAKIAAELGRSKSTVSRELRRNSPEGEYLPARAQEQYSQRRRKCHRKKLLENTELYELVKDKFLNFQWSPEQIAGRLRLEKSAYRISFNTIYRAIYAGMFDTPEQRRSPGNRGAKRKLRHKGKPRRGKGYQENRGRLQISYSITERPKAANNRERLGDWEADTVAGKLGGACLLTLVDRKSRYLICRKLSRKGSQELAAAMVSALQEQPRSSVTPDRGREFLCHEWVTKELDGLPFYFALPHHPWERGTNENTNGLLREYFPKGHDLTDISIAEIQAVEDKLNFRPRKMFGFKTPAEIHFPIVLHLT